MNQLSGAEAVVRMLQKQGVTHLFGLCGDTSLPLYDALFGLDHEITHILTRDERSAAYMADAYARVSGRVGVCEGPSGGGATYILPGVVEANESSVPLLAVTTDIATTSRGRFTLTELGQESLFRPVTKWNRVLGKASAIPATPRPAFICGGGVVIAGAEGELQRLAERLGAPVATTISGKGSISEAHPLAVG